MTDSDPEPGRQVALALGSGGARGYAHIGVIHELQDRGYQIVGIAGSSMGPHVVDGRLLADGGILDPLPMAPIAAVNAGLTIAVSLSGSEAGGGQAGVAMLNRGPRPNG